MSLPEPAVNAAAFCINFISFRLIWFPLPAYYRNVFASNPTGALNCFSNNKHVNKILILVHRTGGIHNEINKRELLDSSSSRCPKQISSLLIYIKYNNVETKSKPITSHVSLRPALRRKRSRRPPLQPARGKPNRTFSVGRKSESRSQVRFFFFTALPLQHEVSYCLKVSGL